MKKDGSSLVRRQLDFREKILTKTTFYIDIREDDLKKRISRRIRDLGGQVEGFLSKDVHILLTDSNNTSQKIGPSASLTPSPDPETKITVPLSRGKALLLKATKQSSSCQQSAQGADIVQNALNLGVKVEKAKDFLKSTHKYAQKLKQVKALQSDSIDGITPLQWKNSDKENFSVLKVEDDRKVFRPFLKHFKDSFPKIRYNDDLASPFDKGVMLCRTVENKTKNRYSTKGKSTVAKGKGGFCEACDYWYRCSLREHLNSMKHQKFVQTNKNFIELDQIINKMPNIKDFMSKFNLDYERSAEIKPNLVLTEKLATKPSTEGCGVDNCKITVETCEIPMEMSASPRCVPVNHDKESVLSNCEIVVSPVPELGNIKCDGDMSMEVDVSTSKYPFDECSRDSGTGPEIQEDISIPCDFIQTVCSNRDTGHITDEDSAFQHDQTSNTIPGSEITTGSVLPNSTLSQSMGSFIGPSIDSDNAVFLDLTVKKNNIPVQEVTSNVRKKLSAIVIADNNGAQSEGCHINHFNIENKENIDNSVREPSSFSFAGVDSLLLTSPAGHNTSPKLAASGVKLDFANIAAGWMKDMSQTPGQQNPETSTTSCKKKRSTKKSKKHSSMSKRKKKLKKKSEVSKESGWPFSLFSTNPNESSESDLELPQLPVMNSNLAKQRLIEKERKLQSSPIQFCSRQMQDQRTSSTCTKKRVNHHHRKSLGIKRLSNSPSFSLSEGLRNIQTKMPQYFSDKLPCSVTPTHIPMVLDSEPPQLSHFRCIEVQQKARPQSCPVLSPMPSSNTVYAQDESLSSRVLDSQSSWQVDSYSQTLPYMQSLDSSQIQGTPKGSKLESENFRTPTNQELDDSGTEEYYNTPTDQVSLLQCDTKNSPLVCKQNVHKKFGTPQQCDNQLSEYDSDTEAYMPYSPECPVLELEQQDSSQATIIPLLCEGGHAAKIYSDKSDSFDKNDAKDGLERQASNTHIGMSNCTNTFTYKTGSEVKSCSELSFSVDSILSGRTGKKRTLSVNGDSEGGLASPSSALYINKDVIEQPMQELQDFTPTTEKKKRKRKRHVSKKDKGAGCQYYACPQEGTKIKLCRVIVTPMEQKNNLKTFWKVTKAGSCRLVFSAEKNKGNNDSKVRKRDSSDDQVQGSKRRKLVY
ncbi:uncharacterized protein LOC110443667 [Mizuhopecten yessoensis]|uniref:uncharacterized protein LOC110443667 n=1 Tax=Mizuhopecten yessoensis TaxID=6573 RepID=UPI000B45BEC9|nr:uncharacterized protein LOC110443667 [Mizuhopecten yessoensis]